MTANNEWLTKMRECILKANTIATERINLLDQLAQQCEELSDVEYDFLFEKINQPFKDRV